jgi:hypothetical protein
VVWPDGFEAARRSPQFWSDYLFLTDAEPENTVQWVIDFPLGTADVLRLDIDLGASDVSLQLVVGGDALALGWDDQAHWHPHCLRWSELQAIGRRLADRGLPQVDTDSALLLLFRFAPVASDLDATVALPALTAAWSRLIATSPDGLAQAIGRADFRTAGVSWVHHPGFGWAIRQRQPLAPDQPEVYSLRVPGGQFPADPWRAFIAELGVV